MSRSDLQTQTRDLLRAEIHQYPAILKEYRRRHRWDWVLWVAAGIFLPFMVVAIMAMGPLLLTFPLHISLLPRIFAVKNPHFGPFTASAEMLLGGEAMVIATVACFTLIHGWGCFCQKKDLVVAAYWPVSDRELNRRNLVSWFTGLLYLAYILALLNVTIALSADHSPLQLAILVISIPLNVWHLMALVIVWCSAIRTSSQPNLCWLSAAGICYSLTLFAGTAFLYAWSPLEGMSEFLLMAPTGWVNGAIRHLFFEPHPLVIGYLAALAATWIYAANWLRRGFCIREILIDANGTVTPVFEYGLLTPPEVLGQTPRLADANTSETAQPESPEQAPTPESVQTKVRCLLWHSWDRCGWMERLISQRMTKRQRMLVEYVYRGQPRWSLAWLISTAITLAGVGLTAGIFELAAWWGNHPDKPTTTVALGLMLWLLMTLYVEMLAHLRSIRAPQRIPTYTGVHPVFPLGLQELMAMHQKVVLGRLLFWLPQLLAIASLDWLFAPKLIGFSYLWACEFAVMFALFVDTFGFMLFCSSVPLTLNWRRVVGLIAFSLMASLWIGAAFLVFMPLAFVAVPALLVVLLCRLGIRKYAGWIYRSALDFQCRETMLTKGR